MEIIKIVQNGIELDVNGGEINASSITQDADNRLVTDAEKTTWNNKVDKVSGKQLSTNDYTTTEKNKLNGIQAGAEVNTVTSVQGKTGSVTVSKSDVGLSNVDNIKQATKAEHEALDTKVTLHLADSETQEKVQEKKNFGRLIADGSEFVHWYGLTDTNITDDTLVKSGAKSVAVKTDTENSTSCVRYSSANLNLSNINNLVFRVNLNNYDIYVKLTIRLHTDTGTYYQYEKTKWELAPLWNDILIPIDNMQIIGTGDANLSNVQHIDLLVTGQDGGSVILDSIYIGHDDKAKVILQFDDADISVFNTAYPIMKKRGIVGSLGVISDMVGSGGYFNLEQLKYLYSTGWDMYNHSKSHLKLAGLTPEELDTELGVCSDYLVNNGIGIASDFVAYPFGLYDEQTLDYMDKNYKFGRTVHSGREIRPSISKYTLKCVELNHSVKDTVYQNIISELKNSGGTCIFLLHKVADSPLSSITYTVAQFEAFIDYLIDSDVEVINTSEWMYLAEAGSQKNTVTSVAGKTGAVTVTKSDVGLGSVNNVAITQTQVTKLNELSYTKAMTQAQYDALSQAEKDRVDVWYGIYEE